MKSLKKASYQCLITEITASLICTASVSLQGAQYWHEFHDYAIVFVFYYIQKIENLINHEISEHTSYLIYANILRKRNLKS